MSKTSSCCAPQDTKASPENSATTALTSYMPVVVIFALAFFMALALVSAMTSSSRPSTMTNQWPLIMMVEFFMAFSVCMLAALKLKDIGSFRTGFVRYDLLAQRWAPYGLIYPYAEASAGIGMLAMSSLAPIAGPISLFIGTVGVVSVYKAVYWDKRHLACACVGGASRVPLGMLSLIENLMMIFMGVWMLLKALG